MMCDALAGVRADDHPGTDRLHLLGVKAALAPGDALHDHLRRGVERDAHLTPALDSSAIFCAASHALTPGSMPLRFRISRPSSWFLPLSRTPRGRFLFRLSRPAATPFPTSPPPATPPTT